MQQPRDVLSIPKLIRSVSEGGIFFLADESAQLRWKRDLERVSPRKVPSSEADLVAVFSQYSQATEKRCWVATFLLGCFLLSNRYGRGRKRYANERAWKGLARYVISLLDSLFAEIGETAFKVIPALAGEREHVSQIEGRN